jgi:hypothetical protein
MAWFTAERHVLNAPVSLATGPDFGFPPSKKFRCHPNEDLRAVAARGALRAHLNFLVHSLDWPLTRLAAWAQVSGP